MTFAAHDIGAVGQAHLVAGEHTQALSAFQEAALLLPQEGICFELVLFCLISTMTFFSCAFACWRGSTSAHPLFRVLLRPRYWRLRCASLAASTCAKALLRMPYLSSTKPSP